MADKKVNEKGKKVHFPYIKHKPSLPTQNKIEKSTSTKGLPELTSNIMRDVNQSIETTFRQIEKIQSSLKFEHKDKRKKDKKKKKKTSKYKTEVTEDESKVIEAYNDSIQDQTDRTLNDFHKKIQEQKKYFRWKNPQNSRVSVKHIQSDKISSPFQEKTFSPRNMPEAFHKNRIKSYQNETKESQESIERKNKEFKDRKPNKISRQELSNSRAQQNESDLNLCWNKKIDIYVSRSRKLLDASLEEEIDRLAMYEKKNENSLEKYLDNRRKLLCYNLKKLST